jgi:RNA polymerase sigma-70 factor (ECF subfamily)
MTTEAAGPPRAEGPENRAWFERLLAQHAPGIVAVLRRRVKRADRVDDALQQALLQAWVARERYDAARPFGPWLRAIALRVAHDQRRAEARRHDRGTLPGAADDARSAAMPDAMNQVADPARTHEAAAEVDEEVARLRRELIHLSATTRRVFTMFYDEERPVAAIAAALALPVNTVKTHLHRARQELARRLRGAGDRP